MHGARQSGSFFIESARREVLGIERREICRIVPDAQKENDSIHKIYERLQRAHSLTNPTYELYCVA